MVPGIASWPVCESEGFQFAGTVKADTLVPHVQTVDFDPVGAESKIRAMLEFCRSQTRPGGPKVFGAQWGDSRLVLYNSAEPMVLYGTVRLDLGLAIDSLSDCSTIEPVSIPASGFAPDWEDNLDRHFWNFLSIIDRTTASRTLILGFGSESCKLGIADGSIYELGRFDGPEAIVRKFRSTARARRKITYFAGARRRKKSALNPLGPMALALAYARTGPGEKTTGPEATWQLSVAGWPVIAPDSAAFCDFARRLKIHRASRDLAAHALGVDELSWFRMDSGSGRVNLSRRDAAGLSEWRNLPQRDLAKRL